MLKPKQLINKKKEKLTAYDILERDDIDKILRFCNIRQKALIMTIYDGGLRKSEAINIKYKHIKFVNTNRPHAHMKIAVSKTTERDMYLVDIIPYLKAYFETESFDKDDYIFYFMGSYKYKKPVDKHKHMNPESLNTTLRRIEKKIKTKYPNWNKKLYPHLFRHSRLTELVRMGINESILRDFAGWTGDSEMASIYVHLAGTEKKEFILDHYYTDKPKEPKPIPKFKTIKCFNPKCKFVNPEQQIFCVKCGWILDERESELKKLKEKIDKLEEIYEIFADSMNKKS